MNRFKLSEKLKARIKNEKESEFPDDPDDTSWGVGMLITTNEAEYLSRLVKEDLRKNAHEICGECDAGKCIPDNIFYQICSITGKFIPVQS